ncbi:pyrimidine dimer DNA glycosylase [Candidatus Microgenomates bacterium]|jgi:uncharacterized protein YabN with tetrapyrrole methylase and pyrophosphatase domain|nr:MAG: pyrimidine dimer DNA glycosylase [Candidatus Microgenomates bacterium]
MRIWDLPPHVLCDKHLLAEHGELHAIWSILTKNKSGYSSHPEVKRWEGKLKALFLRHELQVKEIKKRGFQHKSPLDESFAVGRGKQDKLLNTLPEQRQLLYAKGCSCKV